MRQSRKQIVIVGAGMGGLAAALRLRQAGFQVTIVEKQASAGGRSNVIEEDGYRVDTGPTILVMKNVFDELYESLGEDLDARLRFVRLDPNYRIYYHDGTTLDLYSDLVKLSQEVERIEAGAADRLGQFIDQAAQKYRLGMDFVNRNYDSITDLANPSALVRLLQTRSYEGLWSQVFHTFQNEKLAQAFSFHSMFLGLSPLDSLAMYSLITYADLALGMWYPLGGIYRIVEDMVSMARERGITIRTSAPVAHICVDDGRVTGVLLESGEQIPADLVISNADLPYTYSKLLPYQETAATSKRIDRMHYSCSGYLLYLGVDRVYPHLQHQGVYFSEDYRGNLEAIFKTKRLPQAPSFHLNVPTVTDPSLAPAGHSLLYLLAPVPNLQAGIDWDDAAPVMREALLDQLERIVEPDLRRHIVWERDYRPADFARDYNAVHGTAFGSLAHNFFQSAYFRPHNKSREVEGLYFVGQGTYPGIGMPMVLTSARLVKERIVHEWC
jgi:phytoene desaturase